MRDVSIELPGGRRLGCTELGDPRGAALVYHHGGLSSSADASVLGARCAARGIRLLAPDRPGIGGSDRRRGYRVIDVATDVAALADAHAIERFAVLGWSAGGPYAIACAHVLGERVSGVATSGGAGPPDRASVAQLGMGLDRVLFPLARWAPSLGRVVLAPGRMMPARLGMRQMLHDVRSDGDREVLGDLHPGELKSWFTSGIRGRGTAGMVDDYRALVLDWGFALEDVRAPVTLWQGEQDALVPLGEARELERRLPAGRVELVPGIGHFLLHRHSGRVLDGLGLPG